MELMFGGSKGVAPSILLGTNSYWRPNFVVRWPLQSCCSSGVYAGTSSLRLSSRSFHDDDDDEAPRWVCLFPLLDLRFGSSKSDVFIAMRLLGLLVAGAIGGAGADRFRVRFCNKADN